MHRLTAALATTLLLLAATVQAQPAAVDPFADFTRHWRDDAAWHDDAVEFAEYEVSRLVDGEPRTHTLRITTHRELADPVTTTRSTTGQGRAAFKQYVREDIPATQPPHGSIHFSTKIYIGFDDLKSLKLAVGTQDDGGTTFKQFVNHKGTLTWEQFSYRASEGRRSGSYTPPTDFVFHEALSVVLRGYPFERVANRKLHMLPSQTLPSLTNTQPRLAYIRYVGRESLDLPIGKVDTFHVQASFDADEHGDIGGATPMMDFWFAADGSAPWLHVMVQQRMGDESRVNSPGEAVYRLKSLQRLPHAAE